MKKSNLLLSMAAMMATIAFTACSSDEFESKNAQKSNVISLTSSIGRTRATSELQTTALSTQVKVGVYGVSGTSAIANGNNNSYSVGTTGALSADNSDMVWPSDATAKVSIYAYAPYQSGWTAYNTANSFSVAADQSTDAGYLASDLLYASAADKTQTSDAIALAFAHKLARINVKINKGSDATWTLTGAKVYISNTKPTTTLNPSTGAIGTADGTAADILVATLTSEDETTVYGVVVPQAVAQGATFVKIITSDGTTLAAKLSSEASIETGKSYNFTAKVGTTTEISLTLGSVTLDNWGTGDDLGSSQVEEEEYEYSPSSFVALGGSQSASYADGVYTWESASNNLMTLIEFPLSDGKTLANFKKLVVTTSNLSENAKWRLGYVTDSFTAFAGFGTDQTGETIIDLTALTGVDLSKVTKIQIGGTYGKTPEGGEQVNSGSINISPSDVILRGLVASSGDDNSGNDDNNGDDSKLYATFGTPGGNASYDATSFTYSWTGSTNNLMNCFTFENGELANYATLNFTFSELSEGASVRINVLYSDNTNNSKLYYTAGSKATPISELLSGSYTAADVTAIRFGGNSGSGSTIVKASDMYLE